MHVPDKSTGIQATWADEWLISLEPTRCLRPCPP